VPLLEGEIRFENLNFRYSEDEPVLIDFDLHICPGETIALVGHTGAGKSSIANLIARFYEFQSGEILVDGRDIRSFNLTQFRSQLGIVSIGNGEWLDNLPQGLETQVGERGSLLSMGQRQLVTLMRVLVQRPVIFILDEATASIDPFTEWQIQQALNLILENTTSILIAHRLSTVKAADRIIVLDHGKMIEEGDHDGLLAQGGHYASLYNTYFRHQSIDYKPPDLDEILEARKLLEMGVDKSE